MEKNRKTPEDFSESTLREVASGFERIAKEASTLASKIQNLSDKRGNLDAWAGTIAANANSLSDTLWKHVYNLKRAAQKDLQG
jgi:hypothetical protein